MTHWSVVAIDLVGALAKAHMDMWWSHATRTESAANASISHANASQRTKRRKTSSTSSFHVKLTFCGGFITRISFQFIAYCRAAAPCSYLCDGLNVVIYSITCRRMVRSVSRTLASGSIRWWAQFDICTRSTMRIVTSNAKTFSSRVGWMLKSPTLALRGSAAMTKATRSCRRRFAARQVIFSLSSVQFSFYCWEFFRVNPHRPCTCRLYSICSARDCLRWGLRAEEDWRLVAGLHSLHYAQCGNAIWRHQLKATPAWPEKSQLSIYREDLRKAERWVQVVDTWSAGAVRWSPNRHWASLSSEMAEKTHFKDGLRRWWNVKGSDFKDFLFAVNIGVFILLNFLSFLTMRMMLCVCTCDDPSTWLQVARISVTWDSGRPFRFTSTAAEEEEGRKKEEAEKL